MNLRKIIDRVVVWDHFMYKIKLIYIVYNIMTDQSDKDSMYFTGKNTYNCPFCKRNGVVWSHYHSMEFDESNEKKTYIYKIRCDNCYKCSIHFSRKELTTDRFEGFDENKEEWKEIDDLFFRHKPNSFFLLNGNIDKTIRELFDEAQNCLDNNLLTWASACIRKILYTLLSKEECLIRDWNKTKYEDSFNKLKEKHPHIEVLKYSHNITQLVSDNLHEDSRQERNSKNIKILLSIILEILDELYVIPQLQKQKYNKIESLINEVKQK